MQICIVEAIALYSFALVAVTDMKELENILRKEDKCFTSYQLGHYVPRYQ